MKQNYKAEVKKRLKDFLGDERWIKVIEHENKCEDIPDSSIPAFMNVLNSQIFPNNKKQEIVSL